MKSRLSILIGVGLVSLGILVGLTLAWLLQPAPQSEVSVEITAEVSPTATSTASPTPTPLPPASPTPEQVYYIRPDGSDETGNGSTMSPWATINQALAHVPDGSTILVGAGTYTGRVELKGDFSQGVIIRSEQPYQARLRHDQTVVTGFYGRGLTLEGFDIAHLGPDKGGQYVIQIQDLRGEESGDSNFVSRIILRNNVIHDSYNDDLIKVNNGASQILIEGNIFYNPASAESHIDVNSVTDVIIQDNVFFNDFAGSGRTNHNDTASYIVIKDSNGNKDTNLGSRDIIVRRNILFNWEGLASNTFIVVGEDEVPYYQAYEVLIENNLLLGNSANRMRAAFGVKGARDVIFRHNTVVGDLPAKAFVARLNTQANNQKNKNIYFYNNIWSDPTGTMGAQDPAEANDFSDVSPDETTSVSLVSNLYWNGGNEIPYDRNELLNYTDDTHKIVSDPQLGDQAEIVLPRWESEQGRFADGSSTIREVFERLVQRYGIPGENSPVIDAADPRYAASEDILGQPRPAGSAPDLGAYEQSLVKE